MTQSPDDALVATLYTAHERYKEEFGNPETYDRDNICRLVIGADADKIAGNKELTAVLKETSRGLVDVLRNTMPSEAFPIGLIFEFDRYSGIKLRDISVFNISIGDLCGLGLKKDWPTRIICAEGSRWGPSTPAGLDKIQSDLSLLASLLPPTNREVRGWSIAHNLMGPRSIHVNHERYFARSEAEALLKERYIREGRKALDEIVKAGRMEPRRNDEYQWFISEEIFDLDLDPEGRIPDVLGAVDEISAFLASKRDADIDPDF